MARGRMLNKRISRDKAVARLANEHGAEYALLFTWLIAHLDCEGRMDGDPDVIKGMVAPMIRQVDHEMVAEFLRICSDMRLVEVYEDDRGQRYVQFPGFEKNQVGLRKNREAASEYPSPDECRSWSGSGPRKSKVEVEEKGKEVEEKGREEKRSAPADVQLAHQVWGHYRTYHPNAAKKLSAKNLKRVKGRLSDGFTPDALCQSIDGYHKSPFHLGKNDQGTKYLSFELMMRDSNKVQQGMEFDMDPKLGKIGPVTGLQQWLEARNAKDG